LERAKGNGTDNIKRDLKENWNFVKTVMNFDTKGGKFMDKSCYCQLLKNYAS
jgi:hypothetical protein